MKTGIAILKNNFHSLIIALLVICALSVFKLLFHNDLPGRTFYFLAIIVACYYCFHNLNNEKRWKQISMGVLIGVAIFHCSIIIFNIIKAAYDWNTYSDFMCFYMQGLLGVHNLPFYDPNSFNIILDKVNIPSQILLSSGGIKAEILDVGLLSPPISMLFFAPLASLDYKTSRIILSLLNLIFIIINGVLSYHIFIKNGKYPFTLIFIFIILSLLPGTNVTIAWVQTNFFILFFLLLVIYNIDKPSAGIYLALSLIFKPITGFLILYFIFNKKWKPVIYFITVGIFLFILTGFIWGFHNIVAFFESPPTQRLPHYLYEEIQNQSLIALLNRDLIVYRFPQYLINLIFYLISGIQIVLTIIISKKLQKINTFLSFLPFILCMLMIYPSSLICYMVFIFPIFVYFSLLKRGERYFWIIVIAAASFSFIAVFFTYLIQWIFLIYIAVTYTTKENENYLLY